MMNINWQELGWDGETKLCIWAGPHVAQDSIFYSEFNLNITDYSPLQNLWQEKQEAFAPKTKPAIFLF